MKLPWHYDIAIFCQVQMQKQAAGPGAYSPEARRRLNSSGASPQKWMHLSTTGRSNSMWQCHKYAVEHRRCVHIGFLRHPTFATSWRVIKNVSETFLIVSLFFCRSNARLDSGTCTFTRVGRSELSLLVSRIHACFILYYFVIHCSPVAPCSAQNRIMLTLCL